MAAEAARVGQEGIAKTNEGRDVGEEEEERSQHTAVGEPARAKATSEVDSKRRSRAVYIVQLFICDKILGNKTSAVEHLIYSIIQRVQVIVKAN